MEQSNFSAFLEYLSMKGGEVDKAIDHGQKGLKARKENAKNNKDLTPNKKEEVPEWLIKDYRILFGDEIIRKAQHPNVVNVTQFLIKNLPSRIKGMKFYSKNKFNPNMGAMRGVITKTGEIIWCSSSEFVHGELMIFGMLFNKIPRVEEYSNYNWSGSFESTKDFLAIEHYVYSQTKTRKTRLGLSISYDPTTTGRIVQELKKPSGTCKIYASVFKNVFDVDVNDLKPTGSTL